MTKGLVPNWPNGSHVFLPINKTFFQKNCKYFFSIWNSSAKTKTFNLFLKWFMNMSAKYSNASLNFIPANFSWDISVRFLSWECWDFWRRHDHFRRFPKKSEVCRRSPKSSEDVQSLPKMSEVCRRRSYRENAYPQNQRSWRRYCHLFILHMVFVPYMGLS